MITEYVCNDQAQDLKLTLQSLISIGEQKCRVNKSQQMIIITKMWVSPDLRKVCRLPNIWSYIFLHRSTWTEVQATFVANGASDVINTRNDPQIGSLKCDKHLSVQVCCSGCLQRYRTRNPWKTCTHQFSFTWVIVEDWRWEKGQEHPNHHVCKWWSTTHSQELH